MKKYFIIAVAAVVALAACTKNNVETPSQEARQINFSAVAGKATKAPITNNYFNHGLSAFGVYACYLENGKTWSDDYDESKLYMGTDAGAGVSVSFSGTPDNIWKPASNYYWPLQGGLTFFAYWPYSLTGAVYNEGENTFALGSFTVDTTVADQVDVLVSSFAEDQAANTTQYNDGSVNSGSVNGVPIVFKHMLSQVVFTAAASSEVYAAGLSFKINNITVGARKTSAGMTVVPGGVPSWTDPTTMQAFVVSNTAFPTSGYLATTQSDQIGDALLMIPIDDFKGANSADEDGAVGTDDEYVSVTYTLYRRSDDLAMGQKTVKFYLNDNTTTVSSWAPGYKYTYQLTIDLEKIYFAPTVASWETANQTVNIPQ